MSTKQAIAEISVDNRVLISEISKLQRGAVVTYAEHFTKWLGRPIRNREDLPNFGTAETRLREDYDIVLSVIRGEGYKLLSHTETVGNDSQMMRAFRASKRRKKELATVELSELNEQQKLEFVSKVTQAHLVIETCREKSLKKLEAAANGSATPLALGHAFEALKHNLK